MAKAIDPNLLKINQLRQRKFEAAHGDGEGYERQHGKPTGANPLVVARAFYELFKLYRRITSDVSAPSRARP